MVHQTINTSNTKAPNASSNSKLMKKLLRTLCVGWIVGTLAACSSPPIQPPVVEPLPAPVSAPLPVSAPEDIGPLPAEILQAKSRWTPVRWAELPGFEEDALHEAWNAWIKSCERPGPVFATLCGDVRRLSIGEASAQRQWMRTRLQPYRVDPIDGAATEGLLTAYFEPLLEATRTPRPGYQVPLYQPPLNLGQRKPWYTRQEMDTLPAAQQALRGREIVYLADPVDALVLQIQGSGRIRVTEDDGSQRLVRLAYAGTNDQPYKSVGRWLLDQGAIRDATWPGIKAWIAQNPQRLGEMLWSNPRMVFFKEEKLSDLDMAFGPRGAQGVPLTPGRSIAVDPASIPYGTPVWLASSSPTVVLQKLVLAQDTGSAIRGAVRADYFAGWGPQAGEMAGRLKQSLRMWVFWPKQLR
ncbi:murein transglycosylase A [Rhodoferax sp. PAMC 29310]|uniref:murein transglycosylase A n=1 Tax=Rhodoferax sp. PAMC 29310 TaxID=2822760 RepID=UPI001F0A1216|nr:MltA domain-containing protein [Rhodoferax sp. PAMC 29310]